VHYDADKMPVISDNGKTVRVIAGSILGASSPVRTSSPMFHADVTLPAGAAVPLDADYEERAVYTVSGEIEISGDPFGPAQLLVFRPSDRITIRARSNARLMMLGGEPMDGPKFIWWNFVSSRKDQFNKRRPIGKPHDLIRCRATASSSRFPNRLQRLSTIRDPRP
jgi:redox-sensitive bicupin YhaK (pirin superfamily)